MNGLAYGYRNHPQDGRPVWGARWIWPTDQLYDRQSWIGEGDGDEKLRLLDWLNGTAQFHEGEGAIVMAKRSALDAIEDGWHWQDDSERRLYLDPVGVVLGNPQASCGYLYVCAYLWTDEGEWAQAVDKWVGEEVRK